MPEEADSKGSPGDTGPGDWQSADVKRAIEAAEKAGLQSYRVDIAPDGTISIIVGNRSDTEPPSAE